MAALECTKCGRNCARAGAYIDGQMWCPDCQPRPKRPARHPAKFSAKILTELRRILAQEQTLHGRPIRVLDPFAGTGRIHELASPTIFTAGVELEPEWAGQHPDTLIGDATAMRFSDHSFDAVVTSPCYGNRMADHHEARDASRRNTYRHALDRMPTEGSAAVMQWGDQYRALHLAALVEMDRVIRPGGLLVVNISNHIRDHVEQRVVEWWATQMLNLDHTLVEARPVTTPRLRYGQNHQARVEAEHILITRKGTA